MSYLESVKYDLQQLMPEMAAKYSVHSIGLFGSIVHHDFTEMSDIDIIVDFSKPVGVEFIDLANFLEVRLKRRIDLVSRQGIKPNYLKEIEKEIVYV